MWIILALVSALALATEDALTKKALKGGDEYLVGWLRLLFAMPFLIAVLFLIERPAVDRTFYTAFAVALPFEILAFVLYIKALRLSPLSLTIPFLAFTPVILIGVSYFVLGEKVSGRGVAGILLLAAGSYALNFEHAGKGLLEPLKAIGRERGSLLMLLVAFIYTITASMGKLAITHSSPLYFGTTFIIAACLAYAPLAGRTTLSSLRSTSSASKGSTTPDGKGSMTPFITKSSLKLMPVIGLLQAVMVVTHMLAMSMTDVAYMISLKRTSLLFSVLYGRFLFGEGRMRERMSGAILMFAGFALVATA